MLALLSELPVEIKDHYYQLWDYEGDVHRYHSSYERALQCYQQAEVLAQRAGDPVGESMAIEGQGRIYLDTIQPKRADRFLQRAIQVLELAPDPDAKQRIRLYSLMSENLINSGRAEEARGWYEKSKEIRPDYAEIELEARLNLRTGHLEHTRSLSGEKKAGGEHRLE